MSAALSVVAWTFTAAGTFALLAALVHRPRPAGRHRGIYKDGAER